MVRMVMCLVLAFVTSVHAMDTDGDERKTAHGHGDECKTVKPLHIEKSLHSMRDVLSKSFRGGVERDASLHFDKLTQEEKNDELLHACNTLNGDLLNKALAAGAQVNCIDQHGWTPLFLLCGKKEAKVALVEKLLEAGAKVNVADVHRTTPLYAALFNGHAALVKLLLEYRAKLPAEYKAINLMNGHEKRTYFHLDITSQNIESIRKVIEFDKKGRLDYKVGSSICSIQ